VAWRAAYQDVEKGHPGTFPTPKEKNVIFLLLQNQPLIAIDFGGTSLCRYQGVEILRISTPC
jgi:hypothetical protein